MFFRPPGIQGFLRCVAALIALSAPLCVEALSFSNRYRSPRNPERPFRKSTRLIVLHTTEAGARSSLNKLSERGEAHYCIDEKGVVYRIVDKDREAFHAGRSMWCGREDCDNHSVGIEVVGYHNKPVTLAQLDAIRELVAILKRQYRLDDNQVVCHSHVAYGAPNKWHRRKHRGRKRCGMLFAMPSVRSRLGLSSRPAYDPDVRAKRLVQGDKFLEKVLYGNVDTMAKHYARGKAQAIKAKPKPKPKPVVKPQPEKKADPPKKIVKKTKPEKPNDEIERGEFKKTSKLIVNEETNRPKPIVKGKLIRRQHPETKRESDDIKTGEFKKGAKLIRR